MQFNDCNKLRKLFEVKLGTRGMCNANDIEECRDDLLTVSNAAFVSFIHIPEGGS